MASHLRFCVATGQITACAPHVRGGHNPKGRRPRQPRTILGPALRATNRSPKTLTTYVGAADHLVAFLVAGCLADPGSSRGFEEGKQRVWRSARSQCDAEGVDLGRGQTGPEHPLARRPGMARTVDDGRVRRRTSHPT